MCVGDDPIVRAMPYLISGIISVAITLLLFTIPFIKKWNPKYVKIVKIVFLIISVLLLFLAFMQYSPKFKCI